MKRAAAISTGPYTHLDHLAPICAPLDLPLIVTDETALEIAREFYPQISSSLKPPSELSLDFLSAEFDTLFTCGKFWAMELKPLLKLIFGKEMRFVFCPHGNSDKESRLAGSNIEITQDIALVYGPQMQALSKAKKTITIGNHRYEFFKQYREHFETLREEKIPLDKTKKTLLYAPTWESTATPSSFALSIEAILKQLSGEFNLLIKPHPLLEENHPALFCRIAEKCHKLPQVQFIENYPAIYSLLEHCDLYLGDYSSIGYDFLLFDRPLFFLGPSKKDDVLHRCGQVIDLNNLKISIENLQVNLSQTRQTTYLQAFGEKSLLPKEVGLI